MLHDTLWQAHQQYDSICVLENHTEKYRPSSYHFDSLAHAYFKTDTLYRDRTKTEFRYKLLHDTTYIHRVDTIPRIVRVVETKNKTPVWWWVLMVGLGVVVTLNVHHLSS